MKSTPHLFYFLDDAHPRPAFTNADAAITWQVWRPSISMVAPPGVTGLAFRVWWLFHHARIFVNRDYALCVGYSAGQLVHRSGIYPRYFRFPFMTRTDLQIGDTWTHPEYRGRGLARNAIARIVNELRAPSRRFWYLVEPENIASIRVIERAGFKLAGEGYRRPRWGLSVLGYFQINDAPARHVHKMRHDKDPRFTTKNGALNV